MSHTVPGRAQGANAPAPAEFHAPAAAPSPAPAINKWCARCKCNCAPTANGQKSSASTSQRVALKAPAFFQSFNYNVFTMSSAPIILQCFCKRHLGQENEAEKLGIMIKNFLQFLLSKSVLVICETVKSIKKFYSMHCSLFSQKHSWVVWNICSIWVLIPGSIPIQGLGGYLGFQ